MALGEVRAMFAGKEYSRWLKECRYFTVGRWVLLHACLKIPQISGYAPRSR